MENRYFRDRLEYSYYTLWYRIFFKPGQELVDATGIKHDFVYGTPAGDTQPPQNVDPENEIPPTRVFYILCDEQSKYGYKTGKMVNIPDITSITLTIENTDIILPLRDEPDNWTRPETQTMYVPPGKKQVHSTRLHESESPLFKRRRGDTEETLPETATLSPFRDDQSFTEDTQLYGGKTKRKKKKNKSRKLKRKL